MKKQQQIVVRLEDALQARLQAIIKLHPAMTTSGLVRQALEIGLPSLEQRYLNQQTETTRQRKAA